MRKHKLLSMVATMSFLVTVFNTNRVCMYYANQPKLPTSAKKLRKF